METWSGEKGCSAIRFLWAKSFFLKEINRQLIEVDMMMACNGAT